jgi:RHH-type transcriptional regulator, rel operon repressor / antitoxin RelB
MLAVRLSDEIEERITNLAQRTRRSKSYYVRKAIELFLEDQEDYLSAISRLEEKNDRITLEELKRLIEEKN